MIDLIQIEIQPSDFNDGEMLGFSWNVTEFISDRMDIQLYFENPMYVASTPEDDYLQIEILAPEWFLDQEFHLPLSNSTILFTESLPK